MIDLRDIGGVCVWSHDYEPVDYGDLVVEDFASWWGRNKENLKNLPEVLAKQWIYRHWRVSVAAFIPLDGLQVREETWPSADFITKVGTVRGNEPMKPIHDFEVFSGQKTGKKTPTAQELDTVHWGYPVVVLETPDGFIDCIGDHIEAEYFLVECHKRRRYLNALLNRGASILDQRVFVLRCPSLV